MADGTRLGATTSALLALCDAACAANDAGGAQAFRVRHHVVAFCAFLDRFGFPSVAEISLGACEAFIRSERARDEVPSVRLMRERRTALRFVFRLARQAGLIAVDPTIDITVPRTPPSPVRPLTDAEIGRARAAALWNLSDTRRAAAWALAETTARTSELPHLRFADLDLANARVWIHGGKTTAPRWGHFTDWGVTQIRRRLTAIDTAPGTGLVYQGRNPTDAGQVATCTAIVDVLRRAGLADQPGVRPGSIAGWAGRQILTETGHIDEVARRLGVSSLDRAAALIDFDWQQPEPVT
ncbi:MAG TPA: hypothetical protein PLV93_03070 [Microthrixaceae bacterium]|nr:hypothetical protein [Microthrixaceae bacterium]HNI34350.1 hypothetical protein [Microthrixaceae bacterium]